MEIKIHYNNNVNNKEKRPDYKEFDEFISHIDECSLDLNTFFNETANKCNKLSRVYNKAYIEKNKNVLTDEDFDKLLSIVGENVSADFNADNKDLIKETKLKFDYDFETIKVKILGIYNSCRIKFDIPHIKELMAQIYKCKNMEALIVVTKSYYNGNLYSKGAISSVIGCLCDVLDATCDSLSQIVETSKEQRKIIKKIAKLVNNKRPIAYSLIEELQLWFMDYNIDFEKTLNKDVIGNYNNEISSLKQEVMPQVNTKANINTNTNNKPSLQYFETREERLKKYEIKNKKYKDSGEQELSREELECLNVYFDVIENLSENDIESFENKTTDYLVELLEGEAYPAKLIQCLIEKINNSDSIGYAYKKRITKAVSHLK